jgi:hypothetical protein
MVSGKSGTVKALKQLEFKSSAGLLLQAVGVFSSSDSRVGRERYADSVDARAIHVGAPGTGSALGLALAGAVRNAAARRSESAVER